MTAGAFCASEDRGCDEDCEAGRRHCPNWHRHCPNWREPRYIRDHDPAACDEHWRRPASLREFVDDLADEHGPVSAAELDAVRREPLNLFERVMAVAPPEDAQEIAHIVRNAAVGLLGATLARPDSNRSAGPQECHRTASGIMVHVKPWCHFPGDSGTR